MRAITRLAKEHGSVARTVKPYREYLKVSDDIRQAEELLADADADMKAMIEEELAQLRPQQQSLHDRLEDILLAEGEDFGSLIMEVRAGTGGDEAALFAGDLFCTANVVGHFEILAIGLDGAGHGAVFLGEPGIARTIADDRWIAEQRFQFLMACQDFFKRGPHIAVSCNNHQIRRSA